MINRVALVGGGGHCRACIDVIETTDLVIAGIVDKERNGKLLNYEIIGTDDDIPSLVSRNYSFLITVGQIHSPAIRLLLFEKIKQVGGQFVKVIASTAIVSKHSEIGEGSIVMHQAIVNTSAKIGINCIINNKSLIEHDCTIGDHTHISTAAVVNGGCVIGNRVFVGSNAVIAQDVTVADDVVIGAGAVILKNISLAGTYGGNPAAVISR